MLKHMTFQGLSFVTHRELDGLLGGGASGSKQRRRLVERGWLPKAPMLSGDRDKLAVYPEFVLAALVVPASAAASLSRPVKEAASRAQKLYESAAYRLFEKALKETLMATSSRDVVRIAECAASDYPDAFTTWRDEVRTCIDDLASLDVFLEALPARVIEANDNYVIDIDGRREPHLALDAPQALSAGDLVTRDRVRVASAVRDFLLPVPEVELMISVSEDTLDEQLARALFDGLQGQVRSLPRLKPSREARSLPSNPELDIDVPWSLLVRGNSMSRKSLV